MVISVPNEVLLQQVADVLRGGQSVRLRAKGWSMRPTIRHATDILIIDPISAPLRHGDIVLAKISTGAYVAHRIKLIHDDAVTLLGDGNITTETCRTTDIFGIINRIDRDGRIIDIGGRQARAKAAIIVPVLRVLRRAKAKLKRILKR